MAPLRRKRKTTAPRRRIVDGVILPTKRAKRDATDKSTPSSDDSSDTTRARSTTSSEGAGGRYNRRSGLVANAKGHIGALMTDFEPINVSSPRRPWNGSKKETMISETQKAQPKRVGKSAEATIGSITMPHTPVASNSGVQPYGKEKEVVERISPPIRARKVGIAIQHKIMSKKIYRHEVQFLSERAQKQLNLDVCKGKVKISDTAGCLTIDGQINVHDVVQKARKAPLPSSASTISMITSSYALLRLDRITVEPRDVFGNTVEAHAAAAIYWSAKTSGWLEEMPGTKVYKIMRDDTTLALPATTPFYPLHIIEEKSLNSGETYELSSQAREAREMSSILHSYGMDKRVSDISSRIFVQSGCYAVTNLSYLFDAVCCIICDVLSSKLHDYGEEDIRAGRCDIDAQVRDIAMIDLTTENVMHSISMWRKEGATHLHIDDVAELPFVRAITPLRSQLETSTFLESRQDRRWRRRTSMITFKGARIWLTYGAAMGSMQEIRTQLRPMGQEILDNPAILLQSAICVARKFGVLQQLNVSFARGLAWCFGPTIALQPSNPHRGGAPLHGGKLLS